LKAKKRIRLMRKEKCARDIGKPVCTYACEKKSVRERERERERGRNRDREETESFPLADEFRVLPFVTPFTRQSR